MKESLQQLAKQTRSFYQGLSPGRRISLALIAVATIGAFVAIIAFISHEDMQPVATGMDSEEVQSVAQALKAGSIPCTISSSGDTVLVPSSRIDEARLELAAAGLPRGSVGFELFDKDGMGMTSFREQINYRRALEGELGRTIRNLGEVRGARVHIVLPRKALFRENEKEPSASVVVNLKSGRSLDKRELKGIRYLVASAVEGLRPERVTVLDGQGAVLARMGETGAGSGAEDRMEFQRNIERRLETRVLNLMEPLTGPGKVVAQVTADVDFKHVVETSEVFDPERTVVRSEQRTEEKRSGMDTQASGVAGAQSNLPGGGPGQPGKGKSNYERSAETVNYEMDRRTRRVEGPRGSLRRLSVAVVVDGTYKTEGEGEDAKSTYQGRTGDEMQRFSALVKKAVGFDAGRGDQVEVTHIAFQAPEQVESGSFLDRLDLTQIFRIVALVGLGLLLLLFVVKPIMRGVFGGKSTEILLPPGRRGATVVELEREMGGAARMQPAGLIGPSVAPDGAMEGKPEGEEAGALPPGQPDPGMIVRRLAVDNPDRTVQVLKSWLNEEGP